MTTTKRLALLLSMGILAIFAASSGKSLGQAGAGQPVKGVSQEKSKSPEEKIHVALHRIDNVVIGIGQTFDFEKERVAKAIEKYKVILPNPLPENTQVVLCYSGPLFGLLEKTPGRPTPKLTLDVNMNRDLTDDAALDLPLCENWDEGIIVKIARTYSQPSPHTEWLPYRIGYSADKGRDGQIRENIFLVAIYRHEGEFRLKNHDYELRLIDGDANGHFYREKEGNVNIQIGIKSDMESGGGEYYRFQNRIPLAGELYEFKGIAEDGSWIELVKSTLPVAALGKPAPDLQMTDIAGQSFRVSDYKGRVLLLDFWASWCKPCIAEFPDIKKMIQKFEKRSLAVVGINVDVAEKVEAGKKVMADYQLTWRQVIEGKGLLHPVCQVFGRLPEYGEGFPMYIAIDEQGIAHYATKDYRKMERFLESHFNDPAGPQNTLFVPLTDKRRQKTETRPLTAVDFSGPKVKSLTDSGRLKLPRNLPKDARVGLLPNGIALVACPGAPPEKLRLVFDANGDGDLTNQEVHEIPFLDAVSPDESKMVRVSLRLNYHSGAVGFLNWPFFARPTSQAGAFPGVFFLGDAGNFGGTFFVGDVEYSVEIADLNGDWLLTEEDTTAPGFLKLKMKKGDDWVSVYEGTSRIPIGRSLYRLKFVSDDGNLVELEKEK